MKLADPRKPSETLWGVHVVPQMSHGQYFRVYVQPVVELVDLKAKDDSSDISRMRQTMLAMKNDK